MISQERWKRAQAYEQGYWQGVAKNAADGSYEQIAFYEWRADQLSRRLRAVGVESLLDGSGRVLEMGSGPVGVVGFLPASEKVAVDPLNEYYESNPHLTELRQPEVRYITSPGERVPLESASYDLVIMENCIDHVHDVGAVMGEIRRLLVDGGILYVTVNARSRWGYWVHRALARLSLDPGHPHTFTKRRFAWMIRSHGFETLQLEAASWKAAWVEDLRSGQRRGILKGLLFVSEHLLSVVARKTP